MVTVMNVGQEMIEIEWTENGTPHSIEIAAGESGLIPQKSWDYIKNIPRLSSRLELVP